MTGIELFKKYTGDTVLVAVVPSPTHAKGPTKSSKSFHRARLHALPRDYVENQQHFAQVCRRVTP